MEKQSLRNISVITGNDYEIPYGNIPGKRDRTPSENGRRRCQIITSDNME